VDISPGFLCFRVVWLELDEELGNIVRKCSSSVLNKKTALVLLQTSRVVS